MPLGNLSSGRGEGIIGSTNVRLANEAFGLPPGWQPGGTGRWPVPLETGFSDRLLIDSAVMSVGAEGDAGRGEISGRLRSQAAGGFVPRARYEGVQGRPDRAMRLYGKSHLGGTGHRPIPAGDQPAGFFGGKLPPKTGRSPVPPTFQTGSKENPCSPPALALHRTLK